MNRLKPVLLMLVAFSLAACAAKPKPKAPVASGGPDPLAVEFAKNNALAVQLATDPCAVRLQDDGDALAIFYHENQGFPESLEVLRPLAKKWKLIVDFTCPVSGEPYVYVPRGLSAPGQVKRLVLYDKTPAHDGWRWGVVMTPPPQGMTVVTPEVIRLSQAVLDVYLKSAPQP